MTRNLTTAPHIVHNHINSYVYWDGWFTEEELQKIDKYCASKETTDPLIQRDGAMITDEEYRKSRISMCNVDAENKWIFEKLFGLTNVINDNYYDFNLYGFDFFQYAEYNEGGGKYDEHMDLLPSTNVDLPTPRKLSFSLILSNPADYTGGEFEINAGGGKQIIEQPRGRVLFFPSFILHAVKPVITGKRRSIVAWVLGPKFR